MLEITGKKKNVLMFRNWIRSGIRKVADLAFDINGRLDENSMYNNILRKQNIFAEMSVLKKALLPFRDTLKNMTHVIKEKKDFTKPKEFYLTFLEDKTDDSNIVSSFLQPFIHLASERNLFTRKVFNEKETKLKEYNFKLLHGILPCNVNLKKWRIKDSDICDICHDRQTISHLLIECQYVQPIWLKVNKLFNIVVSFPMLLGINVDLQYNCILTLVGFLIYKDWLLQSLDFKKRSVSPQICKFKSELQLRLNIYDRCKTYSQMHLALLRELVEVFCK